MRLSVTTEVHKESAQRSSAARWQSEWANEQWAIDPMDMMTAEQFEQWLIERHGAEYLEPVPYRWQSGQFAPDRSPKTLIGQLFKAHGQLTRLEVKQLTGYTIGSITGIVRSPTYVECAVVKVPHGYAIKWRLTDAPLHR